MGNAVSSYSYKIFEFSNMTVYKYIFFENIQCIIILLWKEKCSYKTNVYQPKCNIFW